VEAEDTEVVTGGGTLVLLPRTTIAGGGRTPERDPTRLEGTIRSRVGDGGVLAPYVGKLEQPMWEKSQCGNAMGMSHKGNVVLSFIA